MVSDDPHFKRFGNCNHENVNVVKATECIAGKDVITSKTHYNWPSYAYVGRCSVGHLTPVVDKDFNSRAFDAMKPSLNNDSSIINFLIEAVQLKDLFDVEAIKTLIGKSRGLTLGQIMSKDFLNLQFGWLPTIGDIESLFDRLKNGQKAIDVYIKKQNQVLTSHYVEVHDDIKTDVDRTDGGYPNVHCVHKVTGQKTVATMKYKYSIPRLESLNKDLIKLLGFADLLGISSIRAIVWEGTPWSFAIDWIVNVGDVIAQYDTDFLDSDVTVIDYCVSHKYTISEVYTAWRNVGGVAKCGSITTDRYRRTRQLPDSTAFGLKESGRYGAKQMLLSAALLRA
jgi:hypothetical protein